MAVFLSPGGFQLASWSTLPDAAVRESLLRAKFDAIVLDMQHGLHDTASIRDGIAQAVAFAKPAIVRVPVGDLAFVSRALDLGAAAVILPMIDSVADARALVAAAKYAPLGQRSYGPGRAAELHGFPAGGDYMAAANRSTLALAMIETQSAFRDLDAILSVDGLDGVFVGPSDLSISLFGVLDASGPATIASTAEIAAKSKAAGRFCAIYAADAEDAERAREQGFDLVGLSSDAAMLAQAASALADSVYR